MEENIRKQQVFTAMSAFMHVGRAHRAAIDKITSELEIHRSQHKMLVYLMQSETDPSQKEICDHFDISAATVAVTLKKLEKNGYVERTRLGDDNRVNRISVTEKGRNILECTRAIFESCDERVFHGFSPSELETLTLMLNRMKDNIEKEVLCGFAAQRKEEQAQ